MIRLIQLRHPAQGRRVALVENDTLRLLQNTDTPGTIYAWATQALKSGKRLQEIVAEGLSEETVAYDDVYTGPSEWQILPAFDHPEEPGRCLVSGTGLTHRKSADNRNAMHQAVNPDSVTMTDSMRIYAWGVEGGRPEPGIIGAQPEWFYKGNGVILRAHGEPLDVPAFADDGGEEAEIAAVYLNDAAGKPWRVGFAMGNEFSDHEMERKNYLYLAPSKLRTCSLGPELLVDAPFDDLQGTVRIEREGQTLWSHEIQTGESHMVHTLANLEHHHFKYPAHRRPGDAHIHFFGTPGFSFGSGVRLEEGDIMLVEIAGYGRPLRNPIHIETGAPTFTEVGAL